ncbi:hypothetical protein, partial [Proteus faecis]|uniref:hypothetical protein n=1 Tax=Proteus faecis TaxID=2050967 RepID=UPI003075E87D
ERINRQIVVVKRTGKNEIPALPPNHAAVSKDYSAYLIRAPINGLGITWIAPTKETQPSQT